MLAILGREGGEIKYIFKSFLKVFLETTEAFKLSVANLATSGDSIFELRDDFLVLHSPILKPNGDLSLG